MKYSLGLFISLALILTSLRLVAVENDVGFKSDGLTIYGTFSFPDSKCTETFPSVVLLPGSGPTDRNGNQPDLQTDLLKQLAQSLAAHGYASFRFDKRAVKAYQMLWPADSKKLSDFFSWTHFAKDIRQAYATMKKDSRVDSKYCAILGHSEGGMFALDVAAETNPSTLILMATPGRTLEIVLQDQITALLFKQNAAPEQKAYYLKELSRVSKEIKKTGVVPSNVPAGLKELFRSSAGKFLQAGLAVDPAKKIKNYKGPILILNGSLDAQVNPKLDGEALYSYAKRRPKAVQKLKIIKNASHNFKLVKSPAELGFSGPVSESALEEINSWIKEQK